MYPWLIQERKYLGWGFKFGLRLKASYLRVIRLLGDLVASYNQMIPDGLFHRHGTQGLGLLPRTGRQ